MFCTVAAYSSKPQGEKSKIMVAMLLRMPENKHSFFSVSVFLEDVCLTV